MARVLACSKLGSHQKEEPHLSFTRLLAPPWWEEPAVRHYYLSLPCYSSICCNPLWSTIKEITASSSFETVLGFAQVISFRILQELILHELLENFAITGISNLPNLFDGRRAENFEQTTAHEVSDGTEPYKFSNCLFINIIIKILYRSQFSIRPTN